MCIRAILFFQQAAPDDGVVSKSLPDAVDRIVQFVLPFALGSALQIKDTELYGIACFGEL